MASVGRPNNQLKVSCENGWYRLSPMQSYNGVVGERSDGKLIDAYIDSQQARQMDDDALAILNNTPFMCPGIEGLKDIHIINGIFEAAKTGNSVAL
jgi:glucose-fructose oxidoreductase